MKTQLLGNDNSESGKGNVSCGAHTKLEKNAARNELLLVEQRSLFSSLTKAVPVFCEG